MSINRFQTFVNPGQIQVTPYELPFNKMYGVLANKQKYFDTLSENLPNDTLPEHGYLTKDLAHQYQQDYSPEIQSLQEQLYSTGNVPMGQIKKLASKMANDPRTTALQADFAMKGEVDKLQLQPNFSQGVQSFVNPETGEYTQLTPDQLKTNPNVASYYHYTKPEDWIAFANERYDGFVKEQEQAWADEGKIVPDGKGGWNIATPQYEYNPITGQEMLVNYTYETLTAGKTMEIFRNKLLESDGDADSTAYSDYKNRYSMPQFNFWSKKFEKDNGREPTYQEFIDQVFIPSTFPSTYEKTKVSNKKQIIQSSNDENKGSNKKGGLDKTQQSTDGIWAPNGTAMYGSEIAIEFRRKLDEKGFDVEDLDYNEAVQFMGTLDEELEKYKTKDFNNWTELQSLRTTVTNSITDPNLKKKLLSIPIEESGKLFQTIGNPSDKDNYHIIVDLNVMKDLGYSNEQIDIINANLSSKANEDVAQFIYADDIATYGKQLIQNFIDDNGLETYKEYSQEVEKVKSNYIKSVADSDKGLWRLNQNSVEGQQLLTKRLEKDPSFADNEPYYMLINNNGKVVEVTEDNNLSEEYLKKNNLKYWTDIVGNNMSWNKPNELSSSSISSMVNKKLNENPKYNELNKSFKSQISKLNDIYQTEGTIFTLQPNPYPEDSAEWTSYKNKQASAINYVLSDIYSSNTDEFRWVYNNEQLSADERKTLNEKLAGVKIKWDGSDSKKAISAEYDSDGAKLIDLADGTKLRLRADKYDSEFKVDIFVPELNIANKRDTGDANMNWVEMSLTNEQYQRLVTDMGVDNKALLLRERQTFNEQNIKQYGISNATNTYFDTGSNKVEKLYDMQIYATPGQDKLLRSKFKLGNSGSLDLQFGNEFEAAQFQTDVDDLLNMALYKTFGNDGMQTQDEIRNFFMASKNNGGYNLPAEKATQLAKYIMDKTFNTKGRAQYEYNGQLYDVNINSSNYVNLKEIGLPTYGSFDHSLPIVHNSIVPQLSTIIEQFPFLQINSGLRNDKNIDDLIKSGVTEINRDSPHKVGLAVDFVGAKDSEQFKMIEQIINNNKEALNVHMVKYHNNHLHVQFYPNLPSERF